MVAVMLDAVRERSADVYPRTYLDGCRSALVVFAAAFMGAQDAIWIHDAGLTATCIDNDADRLDRMQGLYPAGWEFLQVDAYEWLETAKGAWDVVSVDSPTGHFDRCAERVGVFCKLARSLVVLGIGTDTHVEAPDGWEIVDCIKRSDYEGGVFWSVLCRT